MHYKKHLLLLILLASGTLSMAQEDETVLIAPDPWQSEIIPFPLGFAPEIDLVGFEDLRFAPNWSESSSENFWTYAFVWYVENNKAMTEDILTRYFNSYYDGLMKVEFLNRVDTSKTQQVDHTISLFVKTKDGFDGKIRVYDNFFSKDYMTLNIKVRESFCPKTNKQIIRCDISKQPFDHMIWTTFEEVRLKVKCK